MELLHGVAEERVVLAGDRVDPGEDEALGGLVAGQRHRRRGRRVGERVADLGVAHALEARRDVAHLAGGQLPDRDELRPEDAQLQDLRLGAGAHEADPGVARGASRRRAGRRSPRPCTGRSGSRRRGRGGARPGSPWAAGRGRRSPRGSRAMPVPSFAEARSTSSRGIARTFSSSSITTSGWADGRSILLTTGMITRSWRSARWTLASVWASIPWAASMTRIAPSQACRRAAHLVGEVDVARRVDEVEAVDEAVGGRVLEPDGAGLDRDPLLALEVHRIEDLARHLPGIDRVGELEEAVREGRLAVIDVGDDREVAQAVLGDRHRAPSVAPRRLRARLVVPRNPPGRLSPVRRSPRRAAR